MPDEHLIYVVTLTVDPDHEVEFTRYYHAQHIPAVLEAAPELTSARRYVESGVDGSLRWYHRRSLAIYECGPDADVDRLTSQGAFPPGHPEREHWRAWVTTHVHDVERRVYRQIYRHPRRAWDGPFAGRPLFLVTADVPETAEPAFAAWYQGEYLPRNVAEVPGWVAVRRYGSDRPQPRRTFVVYEAADEAGLARCLAAMRSGARVEENLAWHRWDDVISHQDAATFTPVFRWPD
ncbi:MAG TPA: hypothetical protein VE152_08885 [Acidimicrobiales bacterium]|jgi:hypothetical protein|nr:hypothetical protein [Acidimicrobiales bacterium]